MNARIILALALALGGCGSSASSTDRDDAQSSEALATCTRPMRPANRVRKVIVTHPFVEGDLKKAEILDLHTTGELTRTGVMLDTGPAGYTPIAFTPDGAIALIAQTDGTIAEIAFNSAGQARVVSPSLSFGFYATKITMHPDGDRAYALDPDTDAHGGGVYELAIACNGTITSRGRVVPGGGAYALEFMPQSRTKALFVGQKAFDGADGNDTFALDMRGPRLSGQGTTFGSAPAIASSMAITPDGKYALVTDDSLLAGNRVGVFTIASMKPRQILDTKAPFQVVPSIYGNGALVVNGDAADMISTVKYDPSNVETPFLMGDALDYTLPHPQLPGAAVQITRGSLKGRVLIAELTAVRQVQFMPAGGAADVSQLVWDKTSANIVGTIGVQP